MQTVPKPSKKHNHYHFLPRHSLSLHLCILPLARPSAHHVCALFVSRVIFFNILLVCLLLYGHPHGRWKNNRNPKSFFCCLWSSWTHRTHLGVSATSPDDILVHFLRHKTQNMFIKKRFLLVRRRTIVKQEKLSLCLREMRSTRPGFVSTSHQTPADD